MQRAYCPSYMKNAIEQAGVTTSDVCFASHMDIDLAGDYADTYAVVTRTEFIAIIGEESVTKASGAKRVVAGFKVKEIVRTPIESIKAMKAERLVATGVLTCEVNGERVALVNFSVGLLQEAERVKKVIENIQNGLAPLTDVITDDDKFCKKCGERYPDSQSKICPHCIDKRSITLRLLGFFGHYKSKVLVVVAVMLLGSAFSVASPMIASRSMYDDVLTQGGSYYGLVGAMVLVIVAVRAVTASLNMLYTYVLARTVPWIIYDIKMRIFEAMQRLSVGFYTSKRTGALMNRVNRDATNIYWFFVDGLPYLIVNALTFAGVVAFMCSMSLKLTSVVFVIYPVAIMMFRILWSVFKRFHHKNFVYNAQLNSMVSDSVNGQRVIKAYARETEEANRFEVTAKKQMNVELADYHTASTAFPLIYLFMFLGQIAVMYMGGLMVLNGELTVGSYITFVAYLSMLYGPIEFMSWVSNWWARCVDSAQRVFEVIDAKPDIVEPEHPAEIERMRGDIVVRGVRFEYDPATPVLKGLTLNVPAGGMLGIVGKTGAGKSTLANLIARLYDVSEGEILIDGVNVKEWPLAKLRKDIGIVSQEIYLFIGSIADNIRYAKPNATMEDVIRAAKAAAAHDFIMKLPDGYETRVGAGGQDLSGGERQRLAIARTILQNPRVLILDEATAAMDTETESSIQQALTSLQKDRTTIAIAHRLSTLKDADSLAVIEDGKVIEEGTHVELMKKMGAYHKLYTLQMEGLRVIMDAG